MDYVTVVAHTKCVNVSFYLPLFFRPSPSHSGEVRDVPCVAFPWHSSAGGGSGPGELNRVKVEGWQSTVNLERE